MPERVSLPASPAPLEAMAALIDIKLKNRTDRPAPRGHGPRDTHAMKGNDDGS